MSVRKRGSGERELALPQWSAFRDLIFTSRVRPRMMTDAERASGRVT